MSKYIKPTISLLPLSANAAAASSCSTSTTDAKEILAILKDMGYDVNNAFGIGEGCQEEIIFEDYCKFTSSIQIFYS